MMKNVIAQTRKGKCMNYTEALIMGRQKLIKLFKDYEYILLPILKFIAVFMGINVLQNICAYNGKLSSFMIVSALSLLGAFASASIIIISSILLVTLYVMSINPILGLVIFIVLTLCYLFFMRLFPEESLLCIVTVMALYFNMPLIVPIVAPLISGYASIVAIIMGIGMWFILPELINTFSQVLKEGIDISKLGEITEKIDFDRIIMNTNMFVMMIVFFVVFSVVYIIKKQSIDYSGYIAIGVGGAVNILGLVMAKLFFDNFELGILFIVLGSVLGAGIGIVIQFLSMALDYQRTEFVQFEDEDNLYYVKIVPKIRATTRKSTVKHVYTNNEREQHNFSSNFSKDDTTNIGI